MFENAFFFPLSHHLLFVLDDFLKIGRKIIGVDGKNGLDAVHG
jgi:hypothetical protein